MGTINLAGHSIPLWIIVVAALVIAALAFPRSRKRDRPNQVAAVSHQAVSWQRRAVLNHNEGLVYESAQAVLEQLEPSWNVWPQVSLGEVVETQGRSEADKEAYRWINSKRADFLVVDDRGWPLAVIEYQGKGHYRGNAAERDAVKRTVLAKAGIRYIEVPAEMSKRRGQLDNHLRAEFREIGVVV